MRKYFWTKIPVILALALVFSFVACDLGHDGDTGSTPEKGHYKIDGLTQEYDGKAKPVTITPRSGMSKGAISAYYRGTGATSYAKGKAAPKDAGTYAVTFDVAAAAGWKAAEGLSAGTLTITVPAPKSGDFEISGLSKVYSGSGAVTITPKAGKSTGVISIYYEGTSGTSYAKNSKEPSATGTYAVTFDVAAATGWKEAEGLSGGNLVILPPVVIDSGLVAEKWRVSIVNKKFMVDSGAKPVWFNGANTPWNSWNDFGGSFNAGWWEKEFKKLHDNGINATRVWINCNSQGSIKLDKDGMFSSVSAQHWTDLDKLFEIAAKNKVYIMATLLSFDHFKNPNNTYGDRWRAMIKDKTAVKSFVNNYTSPFAKRYKDNPWLFSVDLMNEPEWLLEKGDHITAASDVIPEADLAYFLAYNASAIHDANGKALITVGFACVKWNADGAGFNRNVVSDTRLKAQYNTGNPCLDFWSPHTYDWVGEWFGVAHYLSPYGTRTGTSKEGFSGGYGLDPSKPAVIGECSAAGTTAKERGFVRSEDRPPGSNSLTTDYEYAYKNGWQGVFPWTSNSVDGNGEINYAATKNMQNKYTNDVFPFGYGN
ncbi:MAG: cellulase family glycosylhydrolase [Treponema sp.]|jgi:hypothetical protein|nr:cellulase family glycosylhydrolase [Treponema sp.]